MPAPSTLGTFLRAFTFGHVRQLDRLLADSLTRAWKAGAGPGLGRLIVDVDSFVGEISGYQKQGAAYGYTKVFGYHPILATRADTREALHIRLRRGSANTQKGIKRFCEELIAHVDRAGASGTKLLRADPGFWNVKVFDLLEAKGWEYPIAIPNINKVKETVEAIDAAAWQPIAYPAGGEAQIAETVYGDRRLIVRRTRLSSVVVMPYLGVAEQRIADQIGSAATRGEGRHNMLCAYLAGALLLGLLANTLFGAWWLDPAVGLLIAGVAVKEGLESRRGEGCACTSDPLAGLPRTTAPTTAAAQADRQRAGVGQRGDAG